MKTIYGIIYKHFRWTCTHNTAVLCNGTLRFGSLAMNGGLLANTITATRNNQIWKQLKKIKMQNIDNNNHKIITKTTKRNVNRIKNFLYYFARMWEKTSSSDQIGSKKSKNINDSNMLCK